MEIEKIFKNLILIDFALLILIVISSMYQSNDIIEVNKYLENNFFSEHEYLIRILSLILFFMYLITLNLLYRFVSYGKKLYVFLILSGLTLNYFSGSVVYTSFSSVLDQIGGIVTGAILVFLFYSPIKDNFKN